MNEWMNEKTLKLHGISLPHPTAKLCHWGTNKGRILFIPGAQILLSQADRQFFLPKCSLKFLQHSPLPQDVPTHPTLGIWDTWWVWCLGCELNVWGTVVLFLVGKGDFSPLLKGQNRLWDTPSTPSLDTNTCLWGLKI
jgi:hypothetical protein